MFSGGSGALIFGEGAEAEFAVRVFESFGIPRGRVIARGPLAQHARERDSLEGSRAAQAGRALAAGDVRLSHAAGDRHLSQGRFRRSKPYPVDWRTGGNEDALRPFPTVGDGLRRTDTAVREWVGLAGVLADGPIVRAVSAAG